ncbi:MAG: hypothetical protein R2874_12985 [Desulfobacterales bacterium]
MSQVSGVSITFPDTRPVSLEEQTPYAQVHALFLHEYFVGHRQRTFPAGWHASRNVQCLISAESGTRLFYPPDGGFLIDSIFLFLFIGKIL